MLIPHETAERWKQLTWIAGRKSTPMERTRWVHISKHGACATDGYSSAWCPLGLRELADGQVLVPNASELRLQIKNPTEQGYHLQLGSYMVDRYRFLRWLVGTSSWVRQVGVYQQWDITKLKKQLGARSKAGQVRWDMGDSVLHVPTARRVMRQVKTKAVADVWIANSMHYLQCDVTGVEFMFTGIHPDIDPGGSEDA